MTARRQVRIGAMLVALCMSARATIGAQTSHDHLGVHLLYNTTFEDWGVGAQFSAPVAHHLEFYPSFDLYFQSPGSAWEANVDVKYRAFGERTDWAYVGTGLNIHHQDIGGFELTRGGWNLFMGAESIRGNVHPFAEARVTVTDQTRFQMQAGFNVTLGHAKH